MSLSADVAARNAYKLRVNLMRMQGSFFVYKNPKGAGKTLSMVAAAWNLREQLGIPILFVGTSVGINREEFGAFRYMTTPDFLASMEQFNALADLETGDGTMRESKESIEQRKRLKGMHLIDSIIVWDESQNWIDAGRRDKVNLTIGHFVEAGRHFGDTLLFASPSKKEIDNRIREQVDCTVNVSNKCQTFRFQDGHRECIREGCDHVFRNEMLWRDGTITEMNWWGPRYFPKYNSWAPTRFRVLTEKQLESIRA